MKATKQWVFPFLAVLAGTLTPAGAATAQQAAKPRLLVLPWVVIDRTTNKECTIGECATMAPSSGVGAEARELALHAQEALDGAMHRHGMMAMIPRKEWGPQWMQLPPDQVVKQGSGCAVCTPAGNLLSYDRAAVQKLGRAVRAEYVWLGVTAVPLTRPIGESAAPECCRQALAHERDELLARSSALLVRVADGQTVWQGDARQLDRDVPRKASAKVGFSPERRREFGVRDTAVTLGKAFGREHRQALRHGAF